MASPEFPPPYRRSSGKQTVVVLVLLVGLAVGTFLICAGVIGFQVYRQMQASLAEEQRAVELPPPQVESPDAKRQAVTAAFASEDVGIAETELDEIRKLFDAVVRVSSENDEQGHRRLIDFDRMHRQIKSSGHLTSLTAAEERIRREELENTLSTASNWSRYQIVHVDRIDEWERVVYGWFWNTAEHLFETRYWIVRRDGRWKVYDWELLQYGLSESASWAIYWEHDAGQYNAYRQLIRQIDAADALMEEGRYPEAAEKIRQARRHQPPPALRGETQVRIAYAWSRCSRPWELLQACRQSDSPESAPGLLFGAARACLDLSRYSEALDFADQFEAVVGRSPNVYELRAEALAQLDRKAEAARVWEQFARSDPENMTALQSLGEALPPDHKEPLVECVLRTPDPIETAVTLAERFSATYDIESVEAMAAVLERQAPQSPRWKFVHGLARETDEEFAAAAELFLQAIAEESDSGTQSRYVYHYLSAMSRAGRPLEGYRQAPDPQNAFYILTDAYEQDDWGISRAIVEELMDEHRQRAPDDQWLDYYKGIFLAEDGRHEDAAEIFAAGLEQTENEDIHPTLRHRLVASLFHAGRALDAYRTVEPPSETFRQLMGLCRWGEKFSLMAELVEEHAARQPDDEQLDFYRAVLLMEEKQYDQAARVLKRGQSTAEDEYLQRQYRDLRLEARLRAGEALAAYREIEPPRETFSWLADQLTTDKDWTTLEALLRAHRDADASDPQLTTAEAEMHWQRENYSALIALLSPWPPERIEGLAEWNQTRLAERLIRSYLRSNRIVEALAEARVLLERGHPFPLLLVHTWARDVEQVQQAMKRVSPDGGRADQLYFDEDVGSIAFSEEFLPLRRQFPPSVPYNVARNQFVLFCNEWDAMEAAALEEKLTSALSDEFSLTPGAPSGADAKSHSFIVRNSDAVVCVTTGRDSYVANPSGIASRVSNDALARALLDHKIWIAIDRLAVNDDYTLDSASEKLAGQVAAALCDGDCLAAYWVNEGRLVEAGEAVREAFASENPAEAMSEWNDPPSEIIRIFRESPDDPDEAAAVRHMRRGLKAFVAAFPRNGESPPEGTFRIQFRYNAGHATEMHWLTVQQIDRGVLDRWEFLGTLTTDSRIDPRLAKGQPFLVETYEVTDWTYTHEGQTHHGRDDSAPAL